MLSIAGPHPQAEAKGQNPLRFTVTMAQAAPKGKVIVVCHRCQLQAFKFGKQNGFQRFRCRTCGKTFSDIPEKPLGELRVEPAKAHQVINLLCEGVGIRKHRAIGQPNLSVRLFNRRFTRLTLGYSKKVENLRFAVALFVAHFNFCRIHSAHKQTPAMAANLTDHTWTVSELMKTTL